MGLDWIKLDWIGLNRGISPVILRTLVESPKTSSLHLSAVSPLPSPAPCLLRFQVPCGVFAPTVARVGVMAAGGLVPGSHMGCSLTWNVVTWYNLRKIAKQHIQCMCVYKYLKQRKPNFLQVKYENLVLSRAHCENIVFPGKAPCFPRMAL